MWKFSTRMSKTGFPGRYLSRNVKDIVGRLPYGVIIEVETILRLLQPVYWEPACDGFTPCDIKLLSVSNVDGVHWQISIPKNMEFE